MLITVIFGYLTMHDPKKDFAPIGKTGLVSFVERIDGHNLRGICDSNNVVLRSARYDYVDDLNGFIVGYYADNETFDVFLANGDSVLCDIEDKFSVCRSGDTVPYLLVTDREKWEYVVLRDGKVIGPGHNLSVCSGQKAVLACDDGGWGVRSFDNESILPDSYQKIIFVSSGDKDNSSGEKTDCLMALKDGRWRRFSPEGLFQDTVPAACVDTLLRLSSCKMQTGNAIFSVRLENN